MKAKAGDHLVIKGHRVGEAERHGEILEVRGPDGSPPYLVRWSEDDHEAVVYPGADAIVEQKRKKASNTS